MLPTVENLTVRKILVSGYRSIGALLVLGLGLFACTAYAADRPNTVVIWGDDIGESNLSAYNFGLMG